MNLTVLGVDVTIEPVAGVFTPSPHGQFYARPIRIAAGERVIDIGTGSGVLGIAAALCGASVVVTDIDARAVAAAELNATTNGVTVEGRVGALFADAEGVFDVIIANLPNEIVAPEYIAKVGNDVAQTFAGGERGNENIRALLAAAPAYMHGASRLYLGVHGQTDYHDTLRTALRDFHVTLIDLAPLHVKPYVVENLEYYRSLADAGVIQLFRDENGAWSSYGYMYELRLRDPARLKEEL